MQVLQDTTAQRFLHSYWKLRQHFICRVNPRLKEGYGLGLPDIFLLHYIAGSDLSPGEIAHALRLPAHAISRRLDALERGGYIVRALDPEDARRRVLSPTPSGERLLADVLTSLEETVAELLGRLEPQERLHLIHLLERLSAKEPL